MDFYIYCLFVVSMALFIYDVFTLSTGFKSICLDILTFITCLMITIGTLNLSPNVYGRNSALIISSILLLIIVGVDFTMIFSRTIPYSPNERMFIRVWVEIADVIMGLFIIFYLF